jgi:hypothetical protein
MPTYGRVSHTQAEAVVTVPTTSLKGRVGSLVAETVVTVPTASLKGRVGSLISETVITETAAQHQPQVSFVFVEVFAVPDAVGTIPFPLQGDRLRMSVNLQGQRLRHLK